MILIYNIDMNILCVPKLSYYIVILSFFIISKLLYKKHNPHYNRHTSYASNFLFFHYNYVLYCILYCEFALTTNYLLA